MYLLRNKEKYQHILVEKIDALLYKTLIINPSPAEPGYTLPLQTM